MPPEIKGQLDIMRSFLAGLAGLVPTAFIARVLWHHRLVKLGHRRFWSWDLLWELPTAALSAVVGSGVAAWAVEWFGISDVGRAFVIANAIVGVCAWMGPRGLEALLCRLLERFGSGGDGKGK